MPQTELIKITVHVQPNASRNEVVGFRDGVLKLKIAVPPVKGQANKELVEYLSDLLHVRKSNLEIIKGVTSKMKTVVIRGLEQNMVRAILEKYQTQ